MAYYDNLRVAFLHPRLEGGGAETVSLTTAKLFSKWGIHCTFIGSKHNPQEFILDEDIKGEIFVLPDSSGFETETNKVALIQKLTQDNIRIAFTCYLDGAFFGQDLQSMSECQFVFWNHTNPFWEHLYKRDLGELGARFSIKKWLQWNILGGKRKLCSPSSLKELQQKYIQDINNFSSYIVLSKEYKNELIDTLCLSSEQANKIYPFTNTLHINPNPQRKKEKIIAVVARLSLVQKRFDLMLDIWSKIQDQLPEWELRFYGSGSYEWLWHKIVHKKRLKRVSLAGYVSNMEEVYNTVSIVCLTSSFEGWPMAIIEAQNHGCIPITFDTYSAAREVIGEEGLQEGLLIPPFDTNRYAETLVKLCTDDAKRDRLQQISLQKRLDYAPDINDEQWHTLLKSLLNK